jgi:hypothetical protein
MIKVGIPFYSVLLTVSRIFHRNIIGWVFQGQCTQLAPSLFTIRLRQVSRFVLTPTAGNMKNPKTGLSAVLFLAANDA